MFVSNKFYKKKNRRNGDLGPLHVIEKYRSKGLGTLAVKALSRSVAVTYDCDIYAAVSADNFHSLRIFEKIGFTKFGEGNVIFLNRK